MKKETKTGERGEALPTTRIFEDKSPQERAASLGIWLLSRDIDRLKKIGDAMFLAEGYNKQILSIIEKLSETGLFPGANAAISNGTRLDEEGRLVSEYDTWSIEMANLDRPELQESKHPHPICQRLSFGGGEYHAVKLSVSHTGLGDDIDNQLVYGSVHLFNVDTDPVRIEIGYGGWTSIDGRFTTDQDIREIDTIFDTLLKDSATEVQQKAIEAQFA